MGKKDVLNPIALQYGVTPKEENGEEENPIARDIRLGIIGGSRPTKIEELSLEELKQKNIEDFRQAEVQEEALRKDLDQYVGLNEQEKKYLIDKNLKGELKGADFSQTLFTMAGLMPEQQKVLTKDAKGNKIYADEKDMFDIIEEQKKDFNYDKLVSDLTSKTQTSSKNSYYMKDKGDGTLIAVPLAINEKPEAKDVKDAQVFSSLDDDAIGDSRLADIAKKAYNIIPSVAQGFISIPETVQGLVTGKTGGTYKLLKSILEESKFKTTQEYQKGILDTEKIDEFSDFLSKDVYDLSGDKILNTVVNVASSLAEFGLTRKMVPIKGKAGIFAAGIAMNIKEPLQAAEDAGVEGRGKYAVAATYALAASGLETFLGIEGKLFDDAATTAKKEMINKIIKDNVEVVGGKLTKESVENLYKETLKEIPSFYAKYAKNTVGDVTDEVVQNMMQNATQEIHDIVMRDEPEAAKFNTKFWSPKALGEYINSAAGGLIGGMGGSLFIKNKQSQTAYDAIKDGKENELKVQLTSGLKEGRLTQEDYDRAIFKIDSYKSYYEATKDRNVTDEEKRKIFDLTYEKENTKSGVERLKQNNPGGINDGLIAAKEQEVRDYTQQINDIWSTAEARTSESPVEEAKVEVPQWRTAMDDFSKEIGNKDKRQSINNSTRDQIQTVVGASPELNKLAEPFSVDFTSPHLPEESTIQIRNGILYEPYLVKQEGKEDVIETRQLPVYAMEDKDGGTWLFAVGQKTETGAEDVTYLIKLDEEGKYEGHQEFKYRTAKKNELTFDDIKPAFDKLGIQAASLTSEIKGIENIPQAEFEEVEEFEEIPEEKGIVESEQFKNVYEKVKAGVSKAKLKLLPNNTVGVTIDGEDVPFASQRYLNKEELPSGDVEVNVRVVENIDGKYGRGVLIETQEGVPLGYIRRAGKETGRVAAEKISPTEDVDIDVPVELSDVAKERLQQIEKDQENYELVEDELSRRYVNKKTGESYTSVSTFVSGKSGGDFEGKNQLRETAFKVGNIINGIVRDFFNGTIKSYSNYAENMSRDDYDDIIRQLQDVIQYAKDKGYSIVTKPLIIADDVNKIAGQPNLLMVDENGKFYVYDVATLRNTKGLETKELLNRRYKDRPTNAERISAQVNILADILNNKYGLEVGRVGVIPFDVDYEVLSKDKPVQITHAVRTKRVDFKRKQILKPTGKTSTAEVKEKVEEVKPIEKKAEEKPKEAKPAEKEVVKEKVKTEEEEAKEQLKETENLLSGDAEKNRKAGKFVKNGIEFVRNKKGEGEKGSQGQVRFTNEAGGAGVVVPFRYKIIEAETLQPSHEGGIRNPLHFIPEAQPKNRNDAGSLQAEDSFAENPRFNELGENTNAYSGAPIVNERNEVIQGNNRSAGLRKGYKQGNEKYKNDLVDNAEKFGFTKEQVSKFKEPILVRETAVTDEFSIELGNYDAKDLETGGKRRIDSIAVVRRMPFDVKGKIANILFREEDKTLNQAIRDNIKDFINLINPYLNQAQRNTIFKDGELTEAGAKDLESVVQQFLYDGGDVALPELFESLSYNQKEGIKKSLPNIFSVGYEKSIIPEIQEAIIALSSFNASGVDKINNWLTQQDMFAEGKTPKEIYTPVAIELAKSLNSATSQKQIQKIFAEYASLVKDKPADMFDEAKKGLTKKEGIKQIFNVEYEESKKISERGGIEIDKKPSAEGGEDVAQQKAKSVKSIFDEAVKLFYKIRGTEGAAKKRNLTQERKELLKENPTVRFIDNNISSIFEQLENKNIIKRKGNCP
jgi:hypothetical protein